LSAGNVLKPEMVKQMARQPLIFALANPVPEILPQVALEARPDAILATGRSDFPNQVNNVLCFPYIFRGALDVGATAINEAMKKAAVVAIAELAEAEQSEEVAAVYSEESLTFGTQYLIPKPFDPRLISKVAPAVAQAAMDSGVATRPITDMHAYIEHLSGFIYHSNLLMKPVFEMAKKTPRRLAYAEGEDERVLHAVQTVVDEGIAKPILVGRPAVIEQRIARLGLRIRAGVDFELVNPDEDPRYREYWTEYHRLMARRGVTPEVAKRDMRRRSTLIAAMLVRMGAADAMLCGTVGQPLHHLRYIDEVIGHRPGSSVYGAMNILLLPRHTLFICDTHVNLDPSAEEIAEMTLLAAEEVRYFGIAPKVALLSHSNFRQPQRCLGAQDGARARTAGTADARAGSGGRDPRRCGAVGIHAQRDLPGGTAEGAGEPAGDAESGCGEHRLQSAQDDGGRRHHHRQHPVGGEQVGAYSDFHRDRAPHCEHECPGRCRGKNQERMMNKQEVELLSREIEMLMAERARLLKVAGAAAVLVANVEVGLLQPKAVVPGEMLSECLNALPEETLRDALESVKAHS